MFWLSGSLNRQDQENSRQAPFAGVKKLVDKIGLGSHALDQQNLNTFRRGHAPRASRGSSLPALSPALNRRNGACRGQCNAPKLASDSSPTNPGRDKRDSGFLPSCETTVSFARPSEDRDGVKPNFPAKEDLLGLQLDEPAPTPAVARKAARSKVMFLTSNVELNSSYKLYSLKFANAVPYLT